MYILSSKWWNTNSATGKMTRFEITTKWFASQLRFYNIHKLGINLYIECHILKCF